MGPRRFLLLVLRLAFVSAVVYAVAGYVPATQRNPWPRFATPVDPFAREPPLSLRSVEVRGDELVVRFYRSYSFPLAREVLVNVTVCGEACTFYLFSERVPPGSVRELTVYAVRGRFCEVYVSASLDSLRVGFWTYIFGCGED